MLREMMFVRLAPRVGLASTLLFGDGSHKSVDRLIETTGTEFTWIKGHKELAVVDGLVVRIGP